MKELQELLEAKRAQVRILYQEIERIVTHLRTSCDHSKQENYIWEHDNGYGRQTKIIGKECCYCGCVDLWSRGHFSAPEAFE
jgi:hypothetical protein